MMPEARRSGAGEAIVPRNKRPLGLRRERIHMISASRMQTNIVAIVPMHVVEPWIAASAWWNALAPNLLGAA